MEEKVNDLYKRYVHACAMCTTLNCKNCTLGAVIEDLAEILEKNEPTVRR